MSANFDSYKIFYYVGKYGNITHAASSLFLSQSTVSRTIQSLEAELGCRLFERYPHGVVLTENGKTLFRHVSSACEEIFAGEDELHKRQNTGGKRIRIGINDYTFTQFVTPALEEFSRDYPDVSVEITSQRYYENDDIFDMLAEGSLDMVCTISPVPEMEGLKIVNVEEFNDVLIAGSRFSELRNRVFDLRELKDYPLIARSAGPGGTSFLEQTFLKHGIRVVPRYRVDSVTSFIPLTRSGLGLAMIPKPSFDSFGINDGIFQVKLTEALPARRVCLVTSRDHSPSPTGECLLRCIKKIIHEKMK